MKKIVNTTLAAIALSIVMISTIDARVRGGGQASDLMQASKDVIDAPKPQKKQQAKAIIKILNEEEMPKKERLKHLQIKRLNQERDVKAQQMVVSDLGYGWFGIGSSAEAKKANDMLKQLKAELNETNKAIYKLERDPEVGKKWSNGVRLGIVTLATVGVAATAYGVDKYAFENQPGMTYLSERVSTGSAYLGRKGRALKQRTVGLSEAQQKLFDAETALDTANAELSAANDAMVNEPENATLRAKVMATRSKVTGLNAKIEDLNKKVEKAIDKENKE
jgi:hypothetical protein